jgi:hypothetical protein
VAIGVALVILTFVAGNPGWGLVNHTNCRVGGELGNFTVWVPSAVVAAPYLGAENGAVLIWSQLPSGYVSVHLNTVATDGNVTAYIVGFENWSVYSRSNVTVLGPGPQATCATPMVAYFAPSAPQDERHGGTTSWPMYFQLTSDVGLSGRLNGSQLCAQVENTSNLSCGVGAEFDLDFSTATGIVDTCGSTQGQALQIVSKEWPVTAPFFWNAHTYTVPLDPGGRDSANFANGTEAWYNYTFPANEGVWQYDNLAETYGTGAGLVFNYSPCS